VINITLKIEQGHRAWDNFLFFVIED